MAANVAEVNDTDFESEVLEAKEPVLVDFWAPWCGPCRMIAPMVEELAGEYAGSVKFVKVNIDESPQFAQKFDVNSIPTLILFKGGSPHGQSFVGVQPKNKIQEALDAAKQ